MKISLLVATPDEELAQLVTRKKNSLVEPSVLDRARNMGARINVAAIIVKKDMDFMRFFESRLEDLSGAIVVLDNRLDHLKELIAPSLFVVSLGNTKPSFNFQNQLRSSYNVGLRAFLILLDRFCQLQFQKMLLLPLENFSAVEIDDLKRLFSDGVNLKGFGDALDRILGSMRSRQKPKTSSGFKETYFVDDQSLFFQLAHEKHSRAETARPPHFQRCFLASRFRFGARFDEFRHFNVSKEGDHVSGVFAACHGAPSIYGPRTHLNVFPNDYIE